MICEDNVNDNFVRGLTREGTLFDIALNRLRSGTGADRSNDEFAGATFGADGDTLFVNIQASRGMTFAIWGPWGRIGFSSKAEPSELVLFGRPATPNRPVRLKGSGPRPPRAATLTGHVRTADPGRRLPAPLQGRLAGRWR